ncbi:hypothetical protein [Pseudomonas sp. D1-1]|uniref:hypothetical protein n=1 Tax=Pseudomonas sp. D1-1 TaxID=1040793 RepID=UPI003DA9B0E0
MVLEGKYLQEHPDIPYADISNKLFAKANGKAPASMTGRLLADAKQAQQTLIHELEKLTEDPQRPPDLEAYHKVLTEAVRAQTDLLGAHVALYEQALTDPQLSTADRQHIERSESAFARHAQQTVGLIPGALKTALTKADATVSALKQLKQPSEEWEHISTMLSDLVEHTSVDGEFKDALDNAKLPAELQKLHQHNDGWVATAKAAAAGAMPQMLASGLAFGFARAVVESAVPDLKAQAFATAPVMAAAHEVGTNLLKPISQEMMGGWSLKPVKASEVIPNPNPRTIVDGELQPLPIEQKEIAMQEVDEQRSRHLNAQQANKNGTGIGEAEAFGAFSLAQGIRQAIGLAKPHIPVEQFGPRTLASMAGGLFMGGLQSAAQLRSSVPDRRGRELPTHTFKEVDEPLANRLAKAASDAVLASDPSNPEVRQSLFSKTYGSLAGLGSAMGVSFAAGRFDSDTPVKQFGQVLLAALGSPALLIPTYAGFQAGAETKAYQAALEQERKAQELPGPGAPAPPPASNFPRTQTAIQNFLSPDRADLPHGSMPGTWGRVAENTYHRVRGGLQVASQIPTELTELAIKKAITREGNNADDEAAPQPPEALPQK